eukprot:940464-Amphidinium_carterae.3
MADSSQRMVTCKFSNLQTYKERRKSVDSSVTSTQMDCATSHWMRDDSEVQDCEKQERCVRYLVTWTYARMSCIWNLGTWNEAHCWVPSSTSRLGEEAAGCMTMLNKRARSAGPQGPDIQSSSAAAASETDAKRVPDLKIQVHCAQRNTEM